MPNVIAVAAISATTTAIAVATFFVCALRIRFDRADRARFFAARLVHPAQSRKSARRRLVVNTRPMAIITR